MLARLWSCRAPPAVVLATGDLFSSRLSGRIWSVAALVHEVASLLEQELPACSVPASS
jgi:hypothetical protein